MKISNETKASLKEKFIRDIENQILSGELKIGDKLPSEREMVEKMGVSLTIVNAGITELASKGFVEIIPRQGIFVSDYVHTGSISTLVSIMEYNNGKLSPREVRSILKTRTVTERLAIEDAVETASDEQIKKLERYIAQLETAADDFEYSSIVMDYFHEIHSMGENVLLPLMFHSFRVPAINLYCKYIARNGRTPVYRSVVDIYEGLRTRDAEKACNASHKILYSAYNGETSIAD